MKLWLLLVVCAVCAAAPSAIENEEIVPVESKDVVTTDVSSRNILVNALIRQMFAYIRYVIKNGSAIFNTPPIDPLIMEHVHIYLPALLINLDLNLKNIRSTGIGDFVVHRSHLNLAELSFDIDISVPNIYISAAHYDLVGDLYAAIPLYGEGVARFEVEEFRFRAKLFLKQSEDGNSVIIDRIESPSFEIPKFKSGLTGVIGGGDIDAIVNAITEDVIIAYVNRFQGVIAHVASKSIILVGNPILEQLNTWRFIAPFIPRPQP